MKPGVAIFRNVLTDKEAKELQPEFRKALDVVFWEVDKIISKTNKEHAEAVIWSNIDNDDMDFLAEYLVDGARKNKIIATMVERTVQSHRHMRAGMITGPRVAQTFMFYGQHGGFSLFPPQNERVSEDGKRNVIPIGTK